MPIYIEGEGVMGLVGVQLHLKPNFRQWKLTYKSMHCHLFHRLIHHMSSYLDSRVDKELSNTRDPHYCKGQEIYQSQQ
jgi:hypothetical protein